MLWTLTSYYFFLIRMAGLTSFFAIVSEQKSAFSPETMTSHGIWVTASACMSLTTYRFATTMIYRSSNAIHIVYFPHIIIYISIIAI